MKSIKKKLSIIALAASILGCKSAMAMAPLSGNSLTSAGYEYFNGKKKSGRNGSKEKSQKRDKVDISLPIPTLDDLKVWVPGLYLVANEIAGDLGLSDHEFFGKNTIAKAAKSGAQYAAEKIPEFVDYLKNKRKTAQYIRNQKLYDESFKIKREDYYYENLEKVLLNFGVGTEMSKKLVKIMNIQQNLDGSLSYNFLSGFLKNGVVPGGNSIAQQIDVSGFRVFVDNLRGKCKLDIDEDEKFIFDGKRYSVQFQRGHGVSNASYYERLRVMNLNSESFHNNGSYSYDYADFFWKTNYFG